MVIWFTGLSGSGKSTIASELKKVLQGQGHIVIIIDADEIRNTINKKLGFSRSDIKENNKTIARLSKELLKDHGFVLVPIISPYESDRELAKSIIGKSFVELYLDCPIHKCIERDVKGLYKKALKGEISNFIGIADSNPYEVPVNPDLKINTDKMNLSESVSYIVKFLN